MRPRRIAFYGNFGDGNLGKECTLQAALEEILRRWPDAKLNCICTGPEDVRARHGIAAFCSLARGPGKSWRRPMPEWAKRAAENPGAAQHGPDVPAKKRATVLRWAVRVLRSVKWLLYKLPLEITHWVRSLAVMARQDMLIVPGTGILTDHPCGPWVWPYELFKCCMLAGLCRVDVLFLSVGAGPIHHPLSRWMITSSLRLARYRSYRDEESKRYLQGLGFDTGRDAVCPNLVFGLHKQNLSRSGRAEARGKVVGLGLKDYSGPVDESGDRGYREYLELMATLVSWLNERGYTVRLLIGDVQYDNRVRGDLLDLLESRNPGAEQPRVLAQPVPTVPELTRQLAETDVVISPRLHNLILALMLEKPVIALWDLPKVKSLLADLGLAEYGLPIERLEAESLAAAFLKIESGRAGLETHIRERVEAYRHAVERQYARVFDDTRELPAKGAAAARMLPP